jgi:hypothetical protein
MKVASLGPFVVQPAPEEDIEIPEENTHSFVKQVDPPDPVGIEDSVRDDEKPKSRLSAKVLDLLAADRERSQEDSMNKKTLYRQMVINSYKRTLWFEKTLAEKSSKVDIAA